MRAHVLCVFGLATLLGSFPAQAQISPSAPLLLNSNAATDSGDDERPQMTTDGLGNWVAVWDSTDTLGGTKGSDADILVSRSADNGATWSPPALLNQTGTTDVADDLRPAIATDGKGVWLAVWSSNQNPGMPQGTETDILFSRSTNNGLTWSYPALLNTNASSDTGEDNIPRIATDGLGDWVVAWESNSDIGGSGTDFDIRVSRSSNNGQTWSAPALLNSYGTVDSGIDSRVEIVSNGAGTWVAAWATNSNIGFVSGFDFDIAVSRSTDNGATWSPAKLLSPVANVDVADDFRPALATDRLGNWVAAWHATGASGTDADIYTSRSSDDGVTWTNAQLLNTNGLTDSGDDENVRVTTDRAGNWVATWESTENLFGTVGFDFEVFQALSTDNGQTWSAPGLLNTDAETDTGFDLVPQIGTDLAGNWVALWESTEKAGSDFDIALSRFALAPRRVAAVQIVPSTTGPTNANNIVFKVTFNQNVVNFNNAADLIITNNGTTNSGVTINGGPRIFNVRVNDVRGPGTFTLAVSTASDVRNASNRPLETSVTSAPVSVKRRATQQPTPSGTCNRR